MLILYRKHPDSVGLIIATIILLGAGVFPLMLTLVGFLRIM